MGIDMSVFNEVTIALTAETQCFAPKVWQLNNSNIFIGTQKRRSK
jgi:hypothetical protein